MLLCSAQMPGRNHQAGCRQGQAPAPWSAVRTRCLEQGRAVRASRNCSCEASPQKPLRALLIYFTASVAHGTIGAMLISGFIHQHGRLGLHCFAGSSINFRCHWMHMTRGAAVLEACHQMQMQPWRHMLMLQSLVCSGTPLVHLPAVDACIAAQGGLEQ